MSKDPSKYSDVSPGAYDYYAWWKRPKGNIAYKTENHIKVWEIFQSEEFWNRYLGKRCR